MGEALFWAIAIVDSPTEPFCLSTHKNKEAADELEKYLKLEPKAPDAEKIKTSIKELRKQ